MSHNLNFLVLSDLHFNVDNYDTLKLRKHLISYLELHFKNKLDFIVLAGDFYYQGKCNIDKTVSYINDIINTVGVMLDNLYLVPGNHDLKRNKKRTEIIKDLISDKNSSEALNEIDNTRFNKLKNDFKSYNILYKALFSVDNCTDLHKIIEKDNYRIVLLNTCIVSGQNNEEGELLLGQKQLYLSLMNNSSEKIGLGFGHHSLKCFNVYEQKKIILNFTDCFVDIYFSGHTHKPGYDFTALPNNIIPTFVSGSLASDSWSENTFLKCEINLNSKSGYLEISNSYDRKYGIKSTKSGETRYVPISDDLQKELIEYSEANKGRFIFSAKNLFKPITYATVNKRFKAALENIGITEDERKSRGLTFHSY